jgi:hypothetical protein
MEEKKKKLLEYIVQVGWLSPDTVQKTVCHLIGQFKYTEQYNNDAFSW